MHSAAHDLKYDSKNNPLCITYSNENNDYRDGDRKICVIDGYPYYQSTGHNSGHRNAWFPFIAINSNTLQQDKRISDLFILRKNENREDHKHNESYIIKSEPCRIIRGRSNDDKIDFYKYQASDICNTHVTKLLVRFSLKSSLIIALRLNHGNPSGQRPANIFSDQQLTAIGLTKQEIETSKTPIQLKSTEVRISDPHEVNQWLINNGASYIAQFLKLQHVLLFESTIKLDAIDPLKALSNEQKNNFDRRVEMKKLRNTLNEYIKYRRDNEPDEHNSFFSHFTGMKKNIKIAAANHVIKALEGWENHMLSSAHYDALHDGRLGQIMKGKIANPHNTSTYCLLSKKRGNGYVSLTLPYAIKFYSDTSDDKKNDEPSIKQAEFNYIIDKYQSTSLFSSFSHFRSTTLSELNYLRFNEYITKAQIEEAIAKDSALRINLFKNKNKDFNSEKSTDAVIINLRNAFEK